MISNLLDLLKNNPRLHAWNCKIVSKDSYQLFFIKQDLDMNREVVVDEYIINIFTKEEVDNKEKMGKATFSIYPTMSIEEVENKINEQIELCKYTLNKSYKLPKKSNIKPILKERGFDNYSLKEAAFIAADSLFEADKFNKGYINSAEIFINYEETRYFDSNDNVFLYTNTSGQIEFVVTFADKEEEIEIYKFIEFDSLDNKFIHDQANKAFLEAANRMKAIKTPAINNVKLLLTGEYVKTYFGHFIEKIRVDNIYNNMSDYQVGQKIAGENGDNLTIRLEPTMKHSTKGAPFDDEGTTLRKLVVIEKGEVKNLWGSNAISKYLHVPSNGIYSNMVVSSGTLQEEDLQEENYVEIVSLSDFEIDTVTGDFGSEIRLAYLHQKNKEKQIITGGSISGNIYESLDTALFSNETEQMNNYIGPKKVLLENIHYNKG